MLMSNPQFTVQFHAGDTFKVNYLHLPLTGPLKAAAVCLPWTPSGVRP